MAPHMTNIQMDNGAYRLNWPMDRFSENKVYHNLRKKKLISIVFRNERRTPNPQWREGRGMNGKGKGTGKGS